MRPWKPVLALIALIAFLSAVYPLASFVYSSIDGDIRFGIYYTLLGETLCMTLNVTNDGSVTLENFSATVVLNTSLGVRNVTIAAGDVGPGENASVTECVVVGAEFTVEEVTFRFSIAGMYPLRVVIHGQG